MRCILCLFALLVASVSGHAAGNTILVFGDSLSAGYGIPPQQAWPALLAQRLRAQGLDYSVANLSISGETTAGGRSRLPAAIREHRPTIVLLALGANDGLRGLPITQFRDNLEAMVSSARKSGAQVLIAGMRLPPNYGPYADQFHQTFSAIATRNKTALLPFLLQPVATQATLFQADQLHPTAAAQPLILEHVWTSLQPLLKPAGQRR